MIRPLVRGVIVDEDRILLTLHRLDGVVYLLPGGEPQVGEPMYAALARHARNQTGYEVSTHELLWVREGLHHHDLGDPNIVELFYKCALSDAAASAPHGGEPSQVGVEWVSREQIAGLTLLPRSLAVPIQAYLADRAVTLPIYALEDS